MAKRKTGLEPATPTPPAASPPTAQRLTYKQEQFVHAYVANGGNGSDAIRTAYGGHIDNHLASVMAAENLAKPGIASYVEKWREEARAASRFTRDMAINILVGMATATQADFARVLERPSDEESYTGLGYKVHALKGANESYKNGNSITLVDKKAVIDDLWEKLGLDKDASDGDRISFLDRFARMGARLGRSGPGGESGSGS